MSAFWSAWVFVLTLLFIWILYRLFRNLQRDNDSADWPSWPTGEAEAGPGRRWSPRRGRATRNLDRDRTHRRPACTHSIGPLVLADWGISCFGTRRR